MNQMQTRQNFTVLKRAGLTPDKFAWLLAAIFALATMPVTAHEAVIVVDRTAAGQINVEVTVEQPHELAPSIFPGIAGYATGELGIHSTVFDDVTNDSFQLSTLSDFRLILLAKDSGMEILNDTGSAFMTNGESFYVGVPPFDTHPLWNLVSGTPGNEYSVTLKFHDLNGIYPDSAPFMLSFTPLIAPVLEIQRENPGQITLAWPTHADDWTLESVSSLTATNWAVVTNVPVISGTNFTVTIEASATQEFFRLHKL